MTENDVLAYTRWRLAGGAVYDRDPATGENRITGRVRMRSVEGDLQVLYAALKWATTVRVGKGRRLLTFHPLQGVRRPHEKNPKRPLATWERFQQARQAAQELTAQAEALRRTAKTEAGRTAADADYDKWVRAELALVLVEATGRRAGSVRQLRWEDLDFAAAEITWRAEADKKHQW
jgi:integrase